MFSLYALVRALAGALSSPRVRHVLQRFTAEAAALFDALLSPGKLIAEVETMRALQAEADRVEAAQPVRAAVLRREAAHLGRR